MVNISMTRILKRLHLHHKLSFRHQGWMLTLDVNKEIRNVDENICHLQDTIYKYFKNECGTVSENGIYAEFRLKCDHLPKSRLKRALRELKSKNNNIDNNEIRYVSKLIRRKMLGKKTTNSLIMMKR